MGGWGGNKRVQRNNVNKPRAAINIKAFVYECENCAALRVQLLS